MTLTIVSLLGSTSAGSVPQRPSPFSRACRSAARDKASHRKQRGGFIQADEVPLEAEPSIDPSPDESIDRLQYSGWLLGVRVFTDSKGLTVWQIDGSLGENRIQAEGATRAEAWHKAALAAAACGMLANWPRPSRLRR